ncbi:MAG: energy transducer TonB [Bacteroidales bacterium]|nr:energy transducer TonB [Bacteroidales bacterium]
MEAKKSPQADLEKKKGLYLEIGLVAILAIALLAFNIKSYDQEEIVVQTRTALDEVDETLIQTAEEEQPPEPPEPEAPEVVTEVNVIENDAESEHELGILDMGDDANKAAEAFTPVEIEEEQEVVEEEIFVFVEEQPGFPGGDAELYKYLGENIKYPDLARNGNIEGQVFVRFVVEKDGSISNVRVMRDIGGGCGNEAVRVVKAMPKWKPGKQRGKAVRTEFNLPVRFTLK